MPQSTVPAKISPEFFSSHADSTPRFRGRLFSRGGGAQGCIAHTLNKCATQCLWVVAPRWGHQWRCRGVLVAGVVGNHPLDPRFSAG